MTIPDKMKAVVLMGSNQLEVKEMPTPKPGPLEVVVKVESTAVCGSNVSLIKKSWEALPPYGSFIIGHEYARTIAAADEFQIRDRVAVEASLGCGDAEAAGSAITQPASITVI